MPRMSIAGAALDPRAAAPDAGDREAEGAAATTAPPADAAA